MLDWEVSRLKSCDISASVFKHEQLNEATQENKTNNKKKEDIVRPLKAMFNERKIKRERENNMKRANSHTRPNIRCMRLYISIIIEMLHIVTV